MPRRKKWNKMSSITVHVGSASNVPHEKKVGLIGGGKSDPFVLARFQGAEQKTKVIDSEENPSWNQTLTFDMQGRPLTSTDALELELYDHEKVGSNRLLGQATVHLHDMIKGAKEKNLAKVNLQDKSRQPLEGCTLNNIKVGYKPPAGADPVDEGGDGGDVEDDLDDEEDEDEGVPGEPGAKRKKRKRKKVAGRKLRSELGTKPLDFQVRIKIVEARQLFGQSINPVCRITMSGQTRQSRIKKATNAPYWNELFFLNVNESPAELFDDVIEFNVYDSKMLRSDSLLGSFKCDIGFVYEEPRHLLLNKWLLLSTPDDAGDGPKGYLKVCVAVLGPGDEAPSFKMLPDEDDDDIEGNLLRPSGVTLRPAILTMKIFRAEDIPQMDAGILNFLSSKAKELVDPYLIFSFAGNDLKTKIMYNNDHPEWNQQLNLAIKFPSMCDRLRLQVNDWDQVGNDDTIGTYFLHVSQISSTGENGFLPTFGPCFVNFYGSTREFSAMPDDFDDMNLGKIPGCAYRGRVMVELKTDFGEIVEQDMVDISPEEILKVQKFERRRKYALHVIFLDATMIGHTDAPVEFEVSMGNYGNKLDANTPPTSSVTQPTNACFDGCRNYFLPWAHTKPCTMLECHWEDISFRLEAVNWINNLKNIVLDYVNGIKLSLRSKMEMETIKPMVNEMFDDFVEKAAVKLPEPIDGTHAPTQLDHLVYDMRRNELDGLIEKANELKTQWKEKMATGGGQAEDVEEVIAQMDSFVAVLDSLKTEPQNSMPDVVIWMISGATRIAYARIPANELLFSNEDDLSGEMCGKLQTIQLRYPGLEKDQKPEIPALLRVRMWLGLAKNESKWHRMQAEFDEGKLSVFAETYENEQKFPPFPWTAAKTQPSFSDSSRKISLKKDVFQPPVGWKWDGDWYVNPELSLAFDKDSGHRTYMDELYEQQDRIPGGEWAASSKPFTDVQGEELAKTKDDVKLPPGWRWDDDWEVDQNRAVDEEGWEYAVQMGFTGYGPVEKMYHCNRRRRIVRSRTLTDDSAVAKPSKKVDKDAGEGWEYAVMFDDKFKFHGHEESMDTARRRRWHRKMVVDTSVAADKRKGCQFIIQRDNKDKSIDVIAPRMFYCYEKPYKYQLRAYVYQARELLAGDSDGFSDPYCVVSFLHQSQKTEILKKSLCPTWDQTLIFEEIEIFGRPDNMQAQKPKILIEIFDEDKLGSDELLGRAYAEPIVKLDMTADERIANLQWYPIMRGVDEGGELLASFELLLVNERDLPFLPPKKGDLYIVPSGIRPVMVRTGLEVVCWGVRNMAKYMLAGVTSPSVEFEIGGHHVETSAIKNTKKNPNFSDNTMFLDVLLPCESLFMPPMNIRVRDHRPFGRKPIVGMTVVKSLEPFKCDPTPINAPDSPLLTLQIDGTTGFSDTDSAVVDLVKIKKEDELNEEDVDWWTKYYASKSPEDNKYAKYLGTGFDMLVIYNKELEKQPEFDNFSDFCHTFDLARGKSDEDQEMAGQVKGTFRVYTLPNDPQTPLPPKVLSSLPSSDPEECLVRIYCILAEDLQPADDSGLADPYIEIELGEKKENNREEYKGNTLTPVFGKMFEVTAVIPIEKDLHVRVMDYDLISSDDVIGEVTIDLESRYLSKHRAICGLPQSYCIDGPTRWRDSQQPMDILKAYCERYGLPEPKYNSDLQSLEIGQRRYKKSELYEAEKIKHSHIGPLEQCLALGFLRKLGTFVPEHVENRPLFNPLQPGIEQGRFSMWVDIFPKSLGDPGPPVNVRERVPTKYELRLIIWNTKDVILEETSITGEAMTDIYVKAWFVGMENAKQETDIHYRSLTGEGMFNWRMIFPFEFIPAEQEMVVREKEFLWSLDETERHIPAKLVVQIWDNDKFSADDFLGTLELELTEIPKPSKSARGATEKVFENEEVSIFDCKRLRGFWPCMTVSENKEDKPQIAGKVEMEIELLTSDEAAEKPAGVGQEEPNANPHLDPPKRPEDSFLWFASPFKTLKYIIWRKYKWVFIGGLLMFLGILFIILFIYAVPDAFANWMFK